MALIPDPYPQGLTLRAITPAAGFALQDGTPAILSWTAPDDGQLHTIMQVAYVYASSEMTGGNINCSFYDPAGNAVTDPEFVTGGLMSGYSNWNSNVLLVAPGTVSAIGQGSALTGGAATCWAEIWAQ
jgi:hypothetical protein